MIPRYTRSEMATIWSEQSKLSIWAHIEAHACDALAAQGHIPTGIGDAIRAVADTALDSQKIADIEQTTHHDVLAFLTHLSDLIGHDTARFVHVGMTSSDIVDTAFNVQLTLAADLLLKTTTRLLVVLKTQAYNYKNTLCIGRSHGIHAEPTTFGLKMAFAYAEIARQRMRLINARKEIATGALSGAVGTFAHIPPDIEEYVCQHMGLSPEPISSQIIPRDRHAMFFATLAVMAGSIERIAVEIRHLQRSEVREVEEKFAVGQKGSSAMPHKRNPILSENLTGLARLVRGYAVPALENTALWHERDISHSSVERVIAPDATIALDFALNRLLSMIEGLQIYPHAMYKNMNATRGLIYSQSVLLALVKHGLGRDIAYAVVQECAMQVWESKNKQFIDVLSDNEHVMAVMDKAALKALFNPKALLPHIDAVFARVFDKRSF